MYLAFFLCVVLPGLNIFVDRILPQPIRGMCGFDSQFTPEYFVTLSGLVSAQGSHYRAGTPNYLGARISLSHNRLDIEAWKRRLVYDQFLLPPYS